MLVVALVRNYRHITGEDQCPYLPVIKPLVRMFDDDIRLCSPIAGTYSAMRVWGVLHKQAAPHALIHRKIAWIYIQYKYLLFTNDSIIIPTVKTKAKDLILMDLP